MSALIVKLAERILDLSGVCYSLAVIEDNAVRGIRNCYPRDLISFYKETVNEIRKQTREDKMTEQCELLKRLIDKEFGTEEEK